MNFDLTWIEPPQGMMKNWIYKWGQERERDLVCVWELLKKNLLSVFCLNFLANNLVFNFLIYIYIYMLALSFL